MTCQICEALSDIVIVTPDDLKKAIHLLKQAINANYLIEVAAVEGNSFDEVGDCCWNDSVQHYFTCLKCRQPFLLQAETYHGSGGSLKAISTLQNQQFICT